MEFTESWKSNLAPTILDKKSFAKNNEMKGDSGKQLQNSQGSIYCSECVTGSCPDLMMKKDDQPPVVLTPQTSHPPLALTLQTPQRAQQLPHLLLSSDSSSPQRALDTREWKSSLRVQMEVVLNAGGARSTGSLERALHLCAFGSPTGLSSDALSPVGSPKKAKASSRLSHFLPSWNSSSESDSGHSTSSDSKKSRDHLRKTEVEPRVEDASYNHYCEPIISKVTDYIYVGNLNAAYSGLTLCRSHIDSIIDMSNVPPERGLLLIPCSCSRGGRHSWSRLKVDIGDLSMAAEARVNQQLHFSDINECIDASAEKRKRVLVYCLDGFSLAPTCVIQYLMVKRNMTLIAAYELLRAKHPVNLKESHQNVLVSLEQALRPWNKVDPECCKQALSRKVAWRLTAQRSIEDAEEIERERRRRARKLSTTQQELDCGEPFKERIVPHDDILHENGFKPSCPSSQDEDEGFGDWTQKMKKSRRRDLEEHITVKEGGTDSKQGGPLIGRKSCTEAPLVEQVDEEQQVSKGSMSRRRYGQEILKREERMNDHKEKVQEGHRNEDTEPGLTEEKDPRAYQREKVKGNQTDMKMSYISKIYLQQEGGQTDKGTHEQEVTSQAAKVKRKLRGISLNQEGRTSMEAFQETGYKLEQIQGSLQERESKEWEREEQRPIETKLEGLRMREEGEEHQWHIQIGDDIDGRVIEEPSFSITERTESLNRCLKKSNSFKKIQNPGFISKIDDKVEQYTHAIESSLKEARAAKEAPTDMTSPPEPVAAKKNLFEAGDAWNQSFTKGSPSKDAEGLKVGVTDLITQWVKGNLDDGSRTSSPKPAEVKYGEVLHKKNLWETLGDTSCFEKPGLGGKGPCSTKRYKFVVTGHGKYEKVAVSDDHCNVCTNEQSSGTCPEHS